MKKNGFIATSLIYSFFLIFVTLFLTIIADYLQNKVLLNTIEKGIKDELNNSMGIKDFEVGDIVNFDNVHGDATTYSNWVIARVDYVNQKLVLYSLDMNGSFPDISTSCSKLENGTKNDLTYSNFNNDIDFAYRNETYYNKLIYTFSNDENENYKVGNDTYVLKNCSICTDSSGNQCSRGEDDCNACNVSDSELTNHEYDSNNNCIVSSIPTANGSASDKYRKRIEFSIKNNNRLSKELVETADGTLMLNCN